MLPFNFSYGLARHRTVRLRDDDYIVGTTLAATLEKPQHNSFSHFVCTLQNINIINGFATAMDRENILFSILFGLGSVAPAIALGFGWTHSALL